MSGYICQLTVLDRVCVIQYTDGIQAVRMWKSHPTHSYRMLVQLTGGMMGFDNYLITVREDQLDEIQRSVSPHLSQPESDDDWITFMRGGVWLRELDPNWHTPVTMEDLFWEAKSIVGIRFARLEYDLERGIVTRISTGYSPCTYSIVSDGGVVSVLEFEFLSDDDSGQ